LIESIYLDIETAVTNGARVSRYTLLIESLASAEKAQKLHANMARRVAALHVERITRLRRDLELEGQRLRDLIRISKAGT
jgi:hypothetical protein